MAREQIADSLADIADRKLDRNECVHEVRKRCKKIRGLLRLVRPELDITFELENAWFRDASRTLSFVRDAQALTETCEKLQRVADAGGKRINRRILNIAHERLAEISGERREITTRLREFAGSMVRASERVGGWSLQGRERQALVGGFMRTYRRGQKAQRVAYALGTAEAFHDWRKRAKYHWYHLRLLRAGWPKVIDAQIAEAKRLGSLLGDHHDLVVLVETLESEPDRFRLRASSWEKYRALIEKRKRELEAEAAQVGDRVYQESPTTLARRIEEYWFS